MTQLTYAGIGSQLSPRQTLAIMTRLATWLLFGSEHGSDDTELQVIRAASTDAT